MKKIISTLAITLLLIGLIGGAASAARRAPRTTRYDLCPIENCEINGAHRHDGVYYCGDYCNEDHSYCYGMEGGRGGCGGGRGNGRGGCCR